MSDSTKVPDPRMNPGDPSAAEPASAPAQIADDSADAEQRNVRPPPNSYAAIYWPWPEDWDGFEEFVKKSREESANRREPPPWW